MRLLITAAAISGAIAFPALAQDAATDPSTMTCADFTAMDAQGQMMAMEAMQASMAAGAMAEGGEDMATDSMAEGTAEMAEGTAETAEGTDDTAMATDSMAEGTEAGAMGSDDPMMTAMMEACAGDPAMMAMDAMTASQTN